MGISIKEILRFYTEGFKHMSVGKTLWKIIALKLFIFFIVIKMLFFPDILEEHFNTDEDRSAYILDTLTQGEK